uniref:Uncharacterized protein n=1 Tax=Seriola dumerili TaxID=41447 RepID=A0A3B4VNQ3_SERDU
MEAIISAAETGFTGSLVGSSIPWGGGLAAYIGTMTGCFFCPELTMFLVSMPRQQSRALLQWEPPHCCVHTHLLHGDLFPSSPPGGSRKLLDACREHSTDKKLFREIFVEPEETTRSGNTELICSHQRSSLRLRPHRPHPFQTRLFCYVSSSVHTTPGFCKHCWTRFILTTLVF